MLSRISLARYVYKKLGQENVDMVRKFIPSINTLCGVTVKDLTNVSYQNLKHVVPDHIENDEYELAIFIVLQSVDKNITLRKVRWSNPRKRLLFLFWIQEQYTLIKRLEDEKLNSSPSAELINAGIHTLDILGDINLIDTIAQGNVQEWEAVRNMPYGRIFEKQLRITLLDAIAEKLETNRKNKRKNQ